MLVKSAEHECRGPKTKSRVGWSANTAYQQPNQAVYVCQSQSQGRKVSPGPELSESWDQVAARKPHSGVEMESSIGPDGKKLWLQSDSSSWAWSSLFSVSMISCPAHWRAAKEQVLNSCLKTLGDCHNCWHYDQEHQLRSVGCREPHNSCGVIETRRGRLILGQMPGTCPPLGPKGITDVSKNLHHKRGDSNIFKARFSLIRCPVSHSMPQTSCPVVPCIMTLKDAEEHI